MEQRFPGFHFDCYISCIHFSDITISEPLPLDVGAIIEDATCNGFNNGSIVSDASGGSGIYNYYWAYSNSTSSSIGSLITGS